MQELHGYYLEDLEVGMTAIHTKTVTEADVVLFAGISGDINPVHLDNDPRRSPRRQDQRHQNRGVFEEGEGGWWR